MSGSVFGARFTVATFGESHGSAIGAVVDGCPAGVPLTEQDIQTDLNRRKPGNSPFTTARAEADQVEILSGVFNHQTTGTPIALLIRNNAQRSTDYSEIANLYRPGHADLTYDLKYGFRDHRGGGRSSGRETAARVAGGAIAKKILSELGISVQAYTLSIANISVDRKHLDFTFQNELNMPDREAYERAAQKIIETKAQGDSLGGVIECVIDGLPSGIGEPVFDKLEAVIGHAILSIGAVKGIEFGVGFAAASMTGSTNNDPLYAEDGKIKKYQNNAGGIYGGITDGSPVVFRAAIKPTPSIAATQKTVNKQTETIDLNIKGRHDPVIVPRAVVVVEAMAAIAVCDSLLMSLSSNIDNIRKILL